MANGWGFNVTCGARTFILEVTRPAGAVFSDMGLRYLGNGEYKVSFNYISDPGQGSPGTDRFDSGVAVPATFDFIGELYLDGAPATSEIPVRRTCP